MAQDLSTFIADNPAKVIIFSSDTSPATVALGLAPGAVGRLFIVTDLKADASERATAGDWPGRMEALNDRGAELTLELFVRWRVAARAG